MIDTRSILFVSFHCKDILSFYQRTTDDKSEYAEYAIVR